MIILYQYQDCDLSFALRIALLLLLSALLSLRFLQ